MADDAKCEAYTDPDGETHICPYLKRFDYLQGVCRDFAEATCKPGTSSLRTPCKLLRMYLPDIDARYLWAYFQF